MCVHFAIRHYYYNEKGHKERKTIRVRRTTINILLQYTAVLLLCCAVCRKSESPKSVKRRQWECHSYEYTTAVPGICWWYVIPRDKLNGGETTKKGFHTL